MFNDKYGLTKAVLEGKKNKTRRLALNSKKDLQVLDSLDLQPEDKSIVQYVIDKYSRFKVGETVAIAQSYETIYTEMSNRPEEDFSTLHIKNIDNLVKTARSTKVDDILKLRDHSEMIPIKATKSVIEFIKKRQNILSEKFKNSALQNFNQAFRDSPGWKNKMFVKAEFMPHRIRITGISLEHLQSISDDDCLKEGIKKSWWMGASGKPLYGFGEHDDSYTSPREAYAALIDKVSGKGTWEKNPWEFVYDFELIK